MIIAEDNLPSISLAPSLPQKGRGGDSSSGSRGEQLCLWSVAYLSKQERHPGSCWPGLRSASTVGRCLLSGAELHTADLFLQGLPSAPMPRAPPPALE